MRKLGAPAGRDDTGFSLIEMIVALLIAGIVFSALATTLVASVQASLFGRQNQQATDVMTRAIEEMRTLEFGSLSIDAAALAGDPRVVAPAGVPSLEVDGTAEPLVTAAVPGVVAKTFVDATETNNTQFTLFRYVTALTKTSDPGTDLARRATVYVTWESRGHEHVRSISTVISYSQRGLPLPVFKFAPPTSSKTIAPGARVIHMFTVTNQGAPDYFNLALSGSTSGFALYADTNGSGAFEDGADHLLADHTGDGVVDTDRMDPSTTFNFFLMRETAPSTPLGTLATTVSAASDGQSPPASLAKTVVATTIISGAAVVPTAPPTPTATPTGPTPPAETVCAAGTPIGVSTGSYTSRRFAMHNAGLDSALEAQLYMSGTLSSRTFLGKYSTDVAPAATGRVVQPTATTITSSDVVLLTDKTTFADWGVQFGSAVEPGCTGEVGLAG